MIKYYRDLQDFLIKILLFFSLITASITLLCKGHNDFIFVSFIFNEYVLCYA